jgi:hypothetical protein
MGDAKTPVRVDAKSFQEPLAWLAETIFEKVFREGVKHAGWPQFVAEDIAMMFAILPQHLQLTLLSQRR